VDAFEVSLEADFNRAGLPAFNMVGLAEGAVREAGSRVFTALRHCACPLPPGKITVNLAPANWRKAGAGYDLPLALALLCAAGILPQDALNGYYCAGELSLTGEVRPIPGVLPVALLAAERKTRGLIIPADNVREAAVVSGLAVYGVRSLSEAIAFLKGELALEQAAKEDYQDLAARLSDFGQDFAEVKGQEHAKRAIEIAAAGGHNILFMGPPGSGKTMLAQRIPGVLPPLDFEEALEVTKIYSVAGQLAPGVSLIARHPFRSPHHTTSYAGMVGGTASPKPGEISLAHRGVLFLDELPEFNKTTLEALRQPLEDGRITIARAAVSVTYPGKIMLVAAMNPCPCGYLGDPKHVCSCPPATVQRYRARLSGPLLDRFDLHVEVPAVPYADLRSKEAGASSQSIRRNVLRAREVQNRRYADTDCRCNAELNGSLLERHCCLDKVEQDFLGEAMNKLALSARSYTRILRLARSIADLDDKKDIGLEHLAEAVNCRVLDREQAWHNGEYQ
jgi:magnesium chelatase family protein